MRVDKKTTVSKKIPTIFRPTTPKFRVAEIEAGPLECPESFEGGVGGRCQGAKYQDERQINPPSGGFVKQPPLAVRLTSR